MLPNILISFTKHISQDHKYVYSVIQQVTSASDEWLVRLNICICTDSMVTSNQQRLNYTTLSFLEKCLV